jgi:signal transduction histidine kinase
VALGVTLTSVIHDAIVRAVRAGPRRGVRLVATLEGALIITAVCVGVWAMTGAGYPWPLWPVLGFTVILTVQALVLYRDRLPWARERELVERVDELTRTRRGALDVQASELRRIERDLHDGAQARLVALSMLMGRAEERLADQPEIAELVRRAREEAGAAIGELRDLARGIAPPILVDRGLVAAAESLAGRVPIEVAVDGPRALERPAPVVETAAYFVVAESLTNATKYGRGAPARVSVAQDDDVLVVEIVDDGPGGADPAGSGLTGLRHRVAALDGTLQVGPGPDGRGTRVRAELPTR